MSDIKDLLSTLGLKHPLERSTCIGYGQRKPDCGCAVAAASRSIAHNLLIEIKDKLKRRGDVTDILYNVASLLLCKRFHQFQAAENVSRWELKIRTYRPPSPIRDAVYSSSRLGESTTSTTLDKQLSREQAIRKCSAGTLLRELKRRVETDRYPDLASRILQLAEELCPLSSDTDESCLAEDLDHDSSSDEGNSDHEEAQTRAGQSGPLCLTSTPPEPIRQSHVECGICTEPYTSRGGDHWECSQCLNRVHQACFDIWSASQIDGGQRVKCVHCRAQT